MMSPGRVPDYPGHVPGDVPAARRAQHHGTADAAVGNPVGGDLQRAHHCALVPLALRGIKYRPEGAASSLRRNLLIYGVGGVIIPFIGIKAIDVVITALRLA